MQRAIVGFDQDEVGDWIALLECGHRQHVRHRPPWHERPWVLTQQGRAQQLGSPLQCRICDEEAAEDGSEGGDLACWADRVCPECGGMERHTPACSSGGSGPPTDQA
jgi:Protein of unknown function (DUF3565)